MRVTLGLNLQQLKDYREVEIDTEAEQVRLVYITPGSGQALAYEQKVREAEAYTANPAIADSAIPHILAEVGITAADKAGVAAVILDMRDQWVDISSQIEHIRQEAKMNVRNVTTKEEFYALPSINWGSVGA